MEQSRDLAENTFLNGIFNRIGQLESTVCEADLYLSFCWEISQLSFIGRKVVLINSIKWWKIKWNYV